MKIIIDTPMKTTLSVKKGLSAKEGRFLAGDIKSFLMRKKSILCDIIIIEDDDGNRQSVP